MGTRILHDVGQDKACFYDSVTGLPFGPVFEDWEATDEDKVPAADAGALAEAFLEHLGTDPRRIQPDALIEEYARWRATVRYVEKTP